MMNCCKFLKQEGTLIGEEHPYPQIGLHYCRIPACTDYGMFEIIPSAPFKVKVARVFRKFCIPTYQHPKCRYHYPSRSEILKAWATVANTHGPCLVHPFSRLNIYRETTMFIIWLILFILRPYNIAFITKKEHFDKMYSMFLIACSLALIINIILNFITGYALNQNHLVMDFKLIAKRYAHTYFVFDLMDAIPIEEIYVICGGQDPKLYYKLLIIHIAQFARLGTFYQYFINVINYGTTFTGPKTLVGKICMFGLFGLHWNTCLLHAWPTFLGYTPKNITTHTQGGPTNEVENHVLYLLDFHQVSSYFFLASTVAKHTKEVVPIIITLLTGFLFRLIVVSNKLIWRMSCDKSIIKCESFLTEISKCLAVDQLSMNIKQRVDLFYRHKYKGKFISDAKMENRLSEHLRHEIFLHSCSHLLLTMSMMRNIGKEIVGELIMDLEPTFFLAGDIIFKHGDEANDMYLVSYGKAAVYTKQGMELMHLADGSVLGIGGHFMKTHNWTVIAIEATEAFVWSRADALRLSRKYEHVFTELTNVFKKRCSEYESMTKEKRILKSHSEYARIHMLLRSKKILEKSRIVHDKINIDREMAKHPFSNEEQVGDKQMSINPLRLSSLIKSAKHNFKSTHEDVQDEKN